MTLAPSLSVVVPTRDRPSALRRCLGALQRQTVDDLEIIVVDDASKDAAAVAAIVAAADARLVRGAGRGPAAARNAGARAARAPVVCLTDDDCAPVPGWAAALAEGIAEGAAASAGPTREAAGHSKGATAAQAITSHLTEVGLDRSTGRLGFAPTCNLACRTEVLLRLPFDEGYPLAAGEDRDWCARLLAAGHTLVHVPRAVVDHHQEVSAAAFWRRQVRYGRGAYRFHRARGPGLAHPRFYAGLVRRGFAAGPAVGILVCAAQVATAIGMALAAREGRAERVTAPGSRARSKDHPR
ncbi:MAG TPA: glycosyltransferase [Solirubrobacteraceae bacterium]|nr:glycosyltransferase [Solirubrobacteraceae bacterium]